MDDTPRAFLEEFRSSILKKRVGQIALAVVLAEGFGASSTHLPGFS
jgi:large-conductance mechanosensitive channel